MQLKKVAIRSKENHATKTGGAHFHVFISNTDGTTLIERTTAEQHALMKGKDGARYNPTKPGYTWSHTIGKNEYDTPDGELAEGEYAVDGNYAEVRLPSADKLEVFQVPKEDIVNDVITQTAIDKINTTFGKNFSETDVIKVPRK